MYSQTEMQTETTKACRRLNASMTFVLLIQMLIVNMWQMHWALRISKSCVPHSKFYSILFCLARWLEKHWSHTTDKFCRFLTYLKAKTVSI